MKKIYLNDGNMKHPGIYIINPQPATSKNDNISDIYHALNILQEWDNHTAFQLRENMKLF